MPLFCGRPVCLRGDYNDLGGYYLVTEDMAHVWVEAFIAGKGWVRIDPSSFALNAGAIWGGGRKPGLLSKLRLTLDSFDHYWNRTIISYDFEQQVHAVRTVSRSLHGMELRKLGKNVWSALLLLAGMCGVIILYKQRKWLLPSREERLLRMFYLGVERDCNIRVEYGRQGLFELASVCANQGVNDFVQIYAGAVYRDRSLTSDEYHRLKRIVREGFSKYL